MCQTLYILLNIRDPSDVMYIIVLLFIFYAIIYFFTPEDENNEEKSEDSYSGQFQNGKYHGQGTYIFKNGDKYVGQFEFGKRHGKGTETWSGAQFLDFAKKSNKINHETHFSVIKSMQINKKRVVIQSLATVGVADGKLDGDELEFLTNLHLVLDIKD